MLILNTHLLHAYGHWQAAAGMNAANEGSSDGSDGALQWLGEEDAESETGTDSDTSDVYTTAPADEDSDDTEMEEEPCARALEDDEVLMSYSGMLCIFHCCRA